MSAAAADAFTRFAENLGTKMLVSFYSLVWLFFFSIIIIIIVSLAARSLSAFLCGRGKEGESGRSIHSISHVIRNVVPLMKKQQHTMTMSFIDAY